MGMIASVSVVIPIIDILIRMMICILVVASIVSVINAENYWEEIMTRCEKYINIYTT